ncbi:cytochrome c oxidase assembly factor 7 homolog [Culicoides brevitarsis]|uniref:cytochrome c oxidase assembly factor 7 homolog n=1 Tax=Culicoides brevitarsis TaxID=469753 RepID=UPI00307B3402
MAYNLKEEGEVKEYLDNLGTEYRFGCFSEKNPEVCHLLGDFLEAIKKDFDKASKVYKSNCDDYNYGKSCLKFGHYSFLAKGKASTKSDPVQALKYYEKGCDLKVSESCLNSGLLLISKNRPSTMERDVPRSLEYLSKSCDLDNALGCYYLSGMYISGVKKTEDVTENDYIIPKNMEKAFVLAQKACNLGNMYACANVSQMYAKGDGTAKDETLSAKYKNMALEMQEELKRQQTLQFQQGL